MTDAQTDKQTDRHKHIVIKAFYAGWISITVYYAKKKVNKIQGLKLN